MCFLLEMLFITIKLLTETNKIILVHWFDWFYDLKQMCMQEKLIQYCPLLKLK